MEKSVIVQKIGIAVVFCIVAVWASDNCIHNGRVCPSRFTVYANETATLKIKIKLTKNEKFIKDESFIKVICDDRTKSMVKVTDFNIASKHYLKVDNTCYFGDRLKNASIKKINSQLFELVIVINNITLGDDKKHLKIGLWTNDHNRLDQEIVLDVSKATTTTPTDKAENEDNGLPGEIIALIVFGIIAFIIVTIAVIWCNRQNHNEDENQDLHLQDRHFQNEEDDEKDEEDEEDEPGDDSQEDPDTDTPV